MAIDLTRREFLKDLGLLGAGVTLAPAGVTGNAAFDWDREKSPGSNRPAWVKTVDKPTTEVDWNKLQRYSEMKTLRHEPQYIDKERNDKLLQIQADNLANWLKASKPGYALRDIALQAATGIGVGQTGLSFLLDPTKVTTPEKRGVPKWTGTPEDAAQLVTAALRHMGAATVGFVQLDTNTTEKLLYSNDPDNKELVISDVAQPSETDKQRIIPKKARTMIVYTIQMSQETLKRAPTALAGQTTTLSYSRFQFMQPRAQTFLMALGYMAMGEASINALGIAPAFGVMAGLGELSRYNRLLTPEYGPMVRVFKLLTDLPIAPTKPINAGLLEFCKACKKCAEACPSKALSFETEPTWEVKGGWNNPGHKAWFEDSVKCINYWRQVGTNCGICFAVCPFASKNKAFVNAFRNAMASTVPAFDGVLKDLDDLLYGNPGASGEPQKDNSSWWQLDLAEYGIDTTQGHRDV
ncbi:MAG: reductive dehalogenase [Chloroflexi bacterium]|nr:reductive dehalogenase [Chloroflexota bacterium]